MNRGLWIARKNYLCTLVKKVSEYYGGDDIEWLREVCKELIETYNDERIEGAIQCYERIAHENRYSVNPHNQKNPGFEFNPGVVPPFIPWTQELKELVSEKQSSGSIGVPGTTGVGALAKLPPNCS